MLDTAISLFNPERNDWLFISRWIWEQTMYVMLSGQNRRSQKKLCAFGVVSTFGGGGELSALYLHLPPLLICIIGLDLCTCHSLFWRTDPSFLAPSYYVRNTGYQLLTRNAPTEYNRPFLWNLHLTTLLVYTSNWLTAANNEHFLWLKTDVNPSTLSSRSQHPKVIYAVVFGVFAWTTLIQTLQRLIAKC